MMPRRKEAIEVDDISDATHCDVHAKQQRWGASCHGGNAGGADTAHGPEGCATEENADTEIYPIRLRQSKLTDGRQPGCSLQLAERQSLICRPSCLVQVGGGAVIARESRFVSRQSMARECRRKGAGLKSGTKKGEEGRPLQKRGRRFARFADER